MGAPSEMATGSASAAAAAAAAAAGASSSSSFVGVNGYGYGGGSNGGSSHNSSVAGITAADNSLSPSANGNILSSLKPTRRYVKEVRTLGIERSVDGWGFNFEIHWSDGAVNHMHRHYDTLYRFQCRLLEMFPDAAGTYGEPRVIPSLPGKKRFMLFMTKSSKEAKDKQLQESRVPEISAYMRHLVRLEPYISQSDHVLSLFDPKIKSQTPPLRADQGVILCGVFRKMAYRTRNWNRRFVYLEVDGFVRYYETARDSRTMLKGIIPVKDIVEVRDATALSIDWPSDAAAETCFGVVTRSRTYFFVAEDKMQADLWVDQLLKAVSALRQYLVSLPPPPPPSEPPPSSIMRGASMSSSRSRFQSNATRRLSVASSSTQSRHLSGSSTRTRRRTMTNGSLDLGDFAEPLSFMLPGHSLDPTASASASAAASPQGQRYQQQQQQQQEQDEEQQQEESFVAAPAPPMHRPPPLPASAHTATQPPMHRPPPPPPSEAMAVAAAAAAAAAADPSPAQAADGDGAAEDGDFRSEDGIASGNVREYDGLPALPADDGLDALPEPPDDLSQDFDYAPAVYNRTAAHNAAAAAAAAPQAWSDVNPADDPNAWDTALTPDGNMYYVNKVTGESVWELPKNVADIMDQMARASLQGPS